MESDLERVKIKLKRIKEASFKAIDELIEVAHAKISLDKEAGDSLADDKVKNAAAAKKLAIFDACDISDKIIEIDKKIKDIENPEEEDDKKKGVEAPRRTPRTPEG